MFYGWSLAEGGQSGRSDGRASSAAEGVVRLAASVRAKVRYAELATRDTSSRFMRTTPVIVSLSAARPDIADQRGACVPNATMAIARRSFRPWSVTTPSAEHGASRWVIRWSWPSRCREPCSVSAELSSPFGVSRGCEPGSPAPAPNPGDQVVIAGSRPHGSRPPRRTPWRPCAEMCRAEEQRRDESDQ